MGSIDLWAGLWVAGVAVGLVAWGYAWGAREVAAQREYIAGAVRENVRKPRG